MFTVAVGHYLGLSKGDCNSEVTTSQVTINRGASVLGWYMANRNRTRVERQCFMQDQNVACHWTCARPLRNLASTRGDGKCRSDAHEIHTCLYNMTIT